MTAAARRGRIRSRRRVAAWAALYAVPLAVHAHARGGGAGWTFDPWIVAPLALAACAYAAGLARWRARSARAAPGAGRRAAAYAGGLAVLAAALVSPLHRAGERSFALHMLEHELLMLAAAPLLVAARPAGILLWSLPRGWRHAAAALLRPAGRAWRALTQPIVATALQAAALWLWHAPRLFDRALASPGWHAAQHAAFFVSALLFWTAMLDRRRAREPFTAIVCLFATALVSGALGALMAFSQSPWYAGYRALALAPWGLDAVEDQQLAGLLMWIPGGLVHAGVALALLLRVIGAGPAGRTAEAGSRHAH